jgi:uncharacterized protein (DUF433 family)
MNTPPVVTIPLRQDEGGAIRIGDTRVLLEMVIYAFLRGQTPEDIVQAYSSLKLDDVYAVITYYLQNRAEVEAYLEQVKTDSTLIRAKIEATQPTMQGIRERLLKRLSEQK